METYLALLGATFQVALLLSSPFLYIAFGESAVQALRLAVSKGSGGSLISASDCAAPEG